MATVALTAPDSGGPSDEKRAVDTGNGPYPPLALSWGEPIEEARRLDMQMLSPSAPAALRSTPPGSQKRWWRGLSGTGPIRSGCWCRSRCGDGAADGTWPQTVPVHRCLSQWGTSTWPWSAGEHAHIKPTPAWSPARTPSARSPWFVFQTRPTWRSQRPFMEQPPSGRAKSPATHAHCGPPSSFTDTGFSPLPTRAPHIGVPRVTG